MLLSLGSSRDKIPRANEDRFDITPVDTLAGGIGVEDGGAAEGRIVNVEMGILLGGGCPSRLVRVAVHAQERDASFLAVGHGFSQFRAGAHGPEDQLVSLLDELFQNPDGVGIINADFRIHMRDNGPVKIHSDYLTHIYTTFS